MTKAMIKRMLAVAGLGLALVLPMEAAQAEDWICTEAASIKQGDTILVCGVATAENEGDAREQALMRARREFQLLCEASTDCRGRPTNVEPLRNSCDTTDDGQVKCYRGLRYSFSDGGGGLFGRATPVATATGQRPDVVKPFNLGVAYYNAVYSASDKAAGTADLPLLTDNYSGVALFFSTAFNHRYGINLDGYWLTNIAHTEQTKTGLDAQFMVGTHLNQSGFKAFFGAGGFAEQWSNDTTSHVFSGAQFVMGIGYNTRGSTFDLVVTIRQTKSYDDYAFNSNVSDLNTSAGGAAFRYGLRF